MGIQFQNMDERIGHIIDALVARFEGMRMVVASASPGFLTQHARYLRSILAAEILEAQDMASFLQTLAVRVDLCLLDLDEFPDAETALITATGNPEHPVPVIGISRTEDVRTRAASMGAVEALPNPVSFGLLQQAVIRCLSKPILVA